MKIGSRSAPVRARSEETRRLSRRAGWARALLWVLVGCACAYAAAQGANLYRRLKAPPRAPVVPFGVNDYGRPAAEVIPASANAGRYQADPDRLELREGCAWGNPGRNPYKGTVEQALRRARLPDEVVAQMKDKIAAGLASDRLEITNETIRTVHENGHFEPRAIKMTFGKTLCVNTRVNFEPGRVERADLYEATDKAGRSYSVMVPYVCGNVSVLGARAERMAPPATPTTLAASGVPGAANGVAPAPSQFAQGGMPGAGGAGGASTLAAGGGGGGVGGASVPEPETWSMMLAGVGLVAWFGRRSRSKRG
jgi:hypothetical protein